MGRCNYNQPLVINVYPHNSIAFHTKRKSNKARNYSWEIGKGGSGDALSGDFKNKDIFKEINIKGRDSGN